MAEEAKVTPVAEEIAPQGTVEALIPPTEVTPAEDKKETAQVETVPLAVFLDLKEDLKTLKKELKESKGSSQARIEVQGLSELTQKYPDVAPEFIQDMLGAATKEAQKKIEEKYSPIIEKQETEKKQIAFDKAFDNLYEKTLQELPDLPKSVDKDAIKALALTPKYRNIPLADILTKLYSLEAVGKPSSEDETRSAPGRVEDVVNFENITSEQKKLVMDDPKARKSYFDWLDKQPGR